MLIRRWQSLTTPSESQIKNLFLQEGLSPFLRELGKETFENCSQFDEVAILASGEVILELGGSKQVLLKPGDRILIPSGTHYTSAAKGESCRLLCAYDL